MPDVKAVPPGDVLALVGGLAQDMREGNVVLTGKTWAAFDRLASLLGRCSRCGAVPAPRSSREACTTCGDVPLCESCLALHQAETADGEV